MDETVDFLDLTTRFALDAIGLAEFGNYFSEIWCLLYKQLLNVGLLSVCTYVDFDFNSTRIQKMNGQASTRCVNENLFDSIFFLFPFLESKFLGAFPKRRKVHRDLDDFLNDMDTIIAHKRKILSDEKAARIEKKESEKDLLMLMIESENKGEDALSDGNSR